MTATACKEASGLRAPLGIRVPRPAFWMLALGSAVLTALFAVVLVSGVLGARGSLVLSNYATIAAPAVATLACWYRSRRVARPYRRGWRLSAYALLAWTSGSVTWAVYELHLGRPVPFPSLADVGYLLFAPLAVAAVLSLPSAGVERFGRLRALLDGFVMSGALLYISWATVLGPAVSTSGSGITALLVVTYPVTTVIVATVALLALARAHAEQRTTLSLAALGLLAVALTDSVYAWLITEGTYATGSVVDVGWFAGFLLIGLAALHPSVRGGPRPQEVAPRRHALWLPYTPLLLGIAMTVGMQLTGKSMGPGLFYIGLVVIIAVLARQLVSLRINSSLAGRLRDTVGTLRSREVELEHQAFHDPLTGLANRSLFAHRTSHALSRTRRPHPVIVLLADLDDFKAVNDSFGHSAGDALLVAVAERLRSVVRPGDTVARLGGDEFAILLEADDLTTAEHVATRIADALAQPLSLPGVLGTVTASIGIAAAGESATQESLLRDADIAMYAAKAAGKGRHALYAEALAHASVSRSRLKCDLSGALARGEFALKYQPIVSVATGQLTGVEALLRWHHPDRGELAPGVFIAMAEETEAIIPIGRWVIAEACLQAARWRDSAPRGAAPLQLAVNLAARQLADPELLPTVSAALAAARLAPASLTLEITESAMPSDDDANMATVLALHSLGVKLAIDDFGTGQSSLSRLRHFPVDTLKVDRSFIAELSVAPTLTPDVLVTAILAVGWGLGMNVVAEGVETHEQLDVLRALGCPEAQGFLFSRPTDPDVIEALIHAGVAPQPARSQARDLKV